MSEGFDVIFGVLLPSDNSDTAWCRMMFGNLAENGIWGVPRSGLIFQRRGDKLVLTDKMPYTEEITEAFEKGADVPPNAKVLEDYQNRDYELIRQKFAEAGITVVREGESNGDSA